MNICFLKSSANSEILMKTLNIRPAFTEYSNSRVSLQANTKLMVHQVEVKDATEKLVILTSPPSSGKTLANLLRIEEAKADTVMLYPTNELIEDQAKSLVDLIQKHLGKKATILSADSLQHHSTSMDYAIIRANSEFLDIDGMAKGSALRSMLDVPAKRRIILTNIEVINLIAKSYYQKSEDILRFLQNFNIFIIDEFHLYTGVALANLIFILYLLKNIKQIILSSATPSNAVNIFAGIFNSAHRIEAKVSSSPIGHQIRQPTKLLLKPSANILGGEVCAQEIAASITELYRRHQSDKPLNQRFIKVLIIVNSVAFCAQLWELLKKQLGEEKVSMISGLVPKKVREWKEVIVATSTVEVGVDFDVASLVFEARDPISFIQRLCRGGRHRPCESIAYVPPEILDKSEQIPDEIDYLDLQEIVRKKLRAPEVYDEFLTSDEAGALLCGFLLGFLRLHPSEAFREHFSDLRRLLEDEKKLNNLIPPLQRASELLPIFQKMDPKVLETIAGSGPRGGAGMIPVVYDKIYGEESILEYVSVKETALLHISELITPTELLKRFKLKMPSWIRSNVLVVTGFLEKPSAVTCICDYENLSRPKLLNPQNFCVHAVTDSQSKIINQVVHNSVIGYFTRAPMVDWRFQWLPVQNVKGKVILGGESFVQYFLDKKLKVY